MQLTRFMPLLFAALLGGLIWVLNRAADIPENGYTPSPTLPDLIVENAQVRRFDQTGHLSTLVVASAATHVPQDDTMLFETLQLEQTKPGQAKVVVTSERAKSIERGSEVWFMGKVEMRRAPFQEQSEFVLRTTDVHVDTEAQIARSDARMTAEMGPQRMRATGFMVDNLNKKIELNSQVSMTYVPNKSVAGSRRHLLP